MPATPDEIGNYSLDLGNDTLAKRVTGLVFQQKLDGIANLEVSLAMKPEDRAKWNVGNSPKEATLSVNHKVLFRGALAHAHTSGTAKVQLSFGDGLMSAAKSTSSRFVKQHSLRDFLQSTVSKCGMDAHFVGDFSERLPGFPQGSASLLGIFAELAGKHGFYFVSRSSSNQIVFLKAGQSLESTNLDVTEDISHLSYDQSAFSAVGRAQFRFFDPKSAEPKQATLSSDELYSGLSAFTEQSSFREKLGWKSAQGAVETHFPDQLHYERGHRLLADHFSKQAMEQESLTVGCFEPVALPGDKVKLTKSHVPGLHEGTYLVSAIRIDIQSALPRTTLRLIRP